MDAKVETHLTDFCVKKFPDTKTPDREDLKEILIDAPIVWEGNEDEHRWMIWFTRVVKIDGMFISYVWGKCTGDNSLEDAGFEWDWDSVCEVVPKKVEQTIYVVP